MGYLISSVLIRRTVNATPKEASFFTGNLPQVLQFVPYKLVFRLRGDEWFGGLFPEGSGWFLRFETVFTVHPAELTVPVNRTHKLAETGSLVGRNKKMPYEYTNKNRSILCNYHRCLSVSQR